MSSPHILLDIAKLYKLDGQQQAPGESFFDLINMLPNHNQLMIDSIKTVSPELDQVITELMSLELDHASMAWTSIVNTIFDLVKIEFIKST